MSREDSGTHAGQKIGRALELARKERGLSLKQVEQATKIRARYLQELERGNLDVLPAVYVQGSLKTYANFLQLDGEALTREFRRLPASRHEPQDPARVEPPKGDYFDRSLIFLGGAAGAGSREITEDEEDAGAAAIPAGGNLVYLGAAALLVLLLVAVALALTLPRDGQPAVSQVREPLISQAPSQVSRAVSEESESAQLQPQQKDDEQSTDDKSDDRQPEQQAGPSDQDTEDDGGPARTGQDQGGDQLAQGPRDAARSASPAVQKEPTTAQPDAAPTPPPTWVLDQGNATGVPANQSGGGTPPSARGSGETRNAPPSSRGGGFDVQVEVGADDPVRITGDPLND
jgi:cytoskeletal protein RodZ